MTIPVLQAAKYLAGRSGWELTPQQMQRILYIANMIHLGDHGSPLVFGFFEAIRFGPRHPELEQAVMQYGAGPIRDVAWPTGRVKPGTTERKVLDESYKALRKASGGKLVAITNRKGGAWETTMERDGNRSPILSDPILAEYKSILKEKADE